ncbi:MAG: lipopolysaccharide transport periplasmic protein LptA [Gammaproteobacteria bacterium]|nr:lipopolysaccharide transport periplasmic protein LptA [Gammaproteobacteria bacterium]MCY4218835.1 lipopolysaccharide transport periplasmic protein LptA [Gammaproteobacteria bacterium]MCY4275870.1 lipopolysaccharide transport periplasmic protein LptA [Gammaproteobacteria bacterium]
MKSKIFIAILTVLMAHTGVAQNTVSDQPLLLNADYIELDFSTGERLYRGNVILTQGDVIMECDEMTTMYDDDDELLHALCIGDPGIFKKQPQQNSQEALTGSAVNITYDRKNNQILLLNEAKLERGRIFVKGYQISHNLITEKTIVQNDEQALGTSGSTGSSNSGVSSRPKVLILPKQNPDG